MFLQGPSEASIGARSRKNRSSISRVRSEFNVHETFLGTTGDLVFVVWPFALKRMGWDSRRISTIGDFNAWHIAANRAAERITQQARSGQLFRTHPPGL